MRALILLYAGCALALPLGCSQALHRRQKDMPTDPGEALPEWAFDAPFYFRPPPDAEPQPANRPDADHPARYFVNNRVILIDRPANDVPIDRAPRITVWWSDTDGCLWTRAGCFGLGQTHFPFLAGDDGDYLIRFVGPGIGESRFEATPPHRIYHLDTCPPEVTITIEPETPAYEPNAPITIHWVAEDLNIDQQAVQVAVCWSWENPDMLAETQDRAEISPTTEPGNRDSRLWQAIGNRLNREGSLDYTIPAYAAGEVLQIQVRAKDRAGNYGVGYSKFIPVNGSSSWPDKQAAAPAPQ